MKSAEFTASAGRSFVERYAKFIQTAPAAVIEEVAFYNRDFSRYGNEVYASIGSRIAHWANFLDQSWFQRRLDLPLLLMSSFDVILDIGFSVPYAFALSSLREQQTINFIFADRESSCVDFFHSLVKMESWQEAARRSRLVQADLETRSGRDLIHKAVKEARPKSLLIVASEILEHLTDTDSVWRWLDEVAKSATLETMIYVTLPIGARIPSHTMEFKSSEDAASWVDRYLPQHSGFVITNPGEPETPFLQAAYCAWAKKVDLS